MSIDIQQPERKNQYRATGIVKGRYQPSDDNKNRGELVTADGTFPASIRHPWWNPPEDEQVFNCWVKTTTDTGLMFCLKGYYQGADKQPVSPAQLEEDTFSIRGNLQWWDAETSKCAIAISPNKDATRKFKPSLSSFTGICPSRRKGHSGKSKRLGKGTNWCCWMAEKSFRLRRKGNLVRVKAKGRTSPNPNRSKSQRRRTRGARNTGTREMSVRLPQPSS
jgi:hypothetical protein